MIFSHLKIFFEGIFILKMQISWYSVKRMSTDLQDLFLYETFLYYNPLLLVVISLYISCSSFIVTFTDMRLKISICEDIDGVAMGNKFVGICSIFSHLCSGFWPWSYSPHTQWNMEGIEFNFRKIMLMFFLFILSYAIPILFNFINFSEVCDMDDSSCTNEHDSIPVPLLPWRSRSSCLTTCTSSFPKLIKYNFEEVI